MKLFRTRPRRLAVALFALGGSLLGVGGAMVPAQANHPDCFELFVWLNWSHDGHNPDYVYEDDCVTEVPMHLGAHPGSNVDLDNDVPPGMLSGAGFETTAPTP
jgi:hypothetical protein